MPPPSVAELQENLLERIEIALSDFELPPPARILRKQIVTGAATPLEIKIVYLSGEKLPSEAETALLERVRKSLDYDAATINLERVAMDVGEISFSRNQTEIPLLGMIELDFAGRMMRENPSLLLSVRVQPRKGEGREIARERLKAISDFLETRWQIVPGRIKLMEAVPLEGKVRLGFQTGAAPAETATQADR